MLEDPQVRLKRDLNQKCNFSKTLQRANLQQIQEHICSPLNQRVITGGVTEDNTASQWLTAVTTETVKMGEV